LSQTPQHNNIEKISSENNLTNRESEVLNLLSNGSTNNMIAQRLFISPNTVKTHVRNIYEKLNVKNRTEAVSKVYYLKITDQITHLDE